MTEILYQALIFLTAAVIAVPIAQRLGLSSVLGYIVAGILIGPAFGLIGSDTKDLQHFAEFGVVLMLFIIGLELDPKKLWELRQKLVGLGGLQVLLCSLTFFAIGLSLNLSWQQAMAIGLILSLSSTAIVLQTLSEKGLIQSQGGQSSFAVLLFQDIAFIPMLALIPLLAVQSSVESAQHAEPHGANLLSSFPASVQTLITLGIICLIVLAGHYLARPMFQFIARTRLREVFTAFALLLVLGISGIMIGIGLSPALGAFIAGVVLAESEYRHELESTIEPFKGLLLGLFFITVGAGINFQLFSEQWMVITTATIVVITIKFLIIYLLAKFFLLQSSDKWLLAASLAQAGEFGFVLLAVCTQSAVLPQSIADQILLVIAMSMLLTPFIFIIYERLILPRVNKKHIEDITNIEHTDEVIIAGNGRFGQIINRLLKSCGYQPIVIDLDIDAIRGFSRYGIKSYFGDTSRPELLEAAGIEHAKLFVLAIDDRERAIKTVAHIRKHYPYLPIVARGFDRRHCYDLYRAGATEIIREVFDSSLRAGRESLVQLGFDQGLAIEVTDLFFKRDRYSVQEGADAYDPNLGRFENQGMITRTLQINEETAQMIQLVIDNHSTSKSAIPRVPKKHPQEKRKLERS